MAKIRTGYLPNASIGKMRVTTRYWSGLVALNPSLASIRCNGLFNEQCKSFMNPCLTSLVCLRLQRTRCLHQSWSWTDSNNLTLVVLSNAQTMSFYAFQRQTLHSRRCGSSLHILAYDLVFSLSVLSMMEIICTLLQLGLQSPEPVLKIVLIVSPF